MPLVMGCSLEGTKAPMLPNGGKASTSQKNPPGGNNRRVALNEAHTLTTSQTRKLPISVGWN
jgi:hypothetical protein